MEAKPWVELDRGTLNWGSYAAIGAFGLVETAMDALVSTGHGIRPSMLKQVANALARVIASTQISLGEPPSMQTGLHTRLRGALHSVLAANPLPVGQPDEAWDEWEKRTARALEVIADTALACWQTVREEYAPTTPSPAPTTEQDDPFDGIELDLDDQAQADTIAD